MGDEMNDETKELFLHLLGTIAYRMQAALRGAPEGFGDFEPGSGVRPPREIVRHVTAVTGYALSFFGDPNPKPERLPSFGAELARFHARLGELGDRVRAGESPAGVTFFQLAQGPVADALTHVGQIAMMRRMAGSPVPGENFFLATVDGANLGVDQPAAAAPR